MNPELGAKNPADTIILVDMDGVVANFDAMFLAHYRIKHPDLPFIPLSARKTFKPIDDYATILGIDKKLTKDIYLAEGFFASIPPIEGAKEALNEMRAAGYTVYLCTSPLHEYEHCVKEKYDWVKRHLGPEWIDQIIFTYDKTLINGTFLIDDKPKIIGIANPSWVHVVFTQPYNLDVKTDNRIIRWAEWHHVLTSIKPKERIPLAKDIVLIDIDGVLADFDKWFLQQYQTEYPDCPFIPVSERLTFYVSQDYSNRFGVNSDIIKKIYRAKGFFANIPLIDGVSDALIDMEKSGLEIYLCASSLSNGDNTIEKFDWVYKNLGEKWIDRIIMTRDKTLARGKCLIDDKPGGINGAVSKPDWTQILFNQPYNAHVNDLDRMMGWG